jgi:hypothetical protein
MIAEALAVVALTLLGAVERWRVDWPHLWTWLQGAPLGDALAGLLRWAMLALAWWLLVSSLLYCLARLSRIPAFVRGTGWFTVPFVRFAVDRALVVTLAASTVVGARAGAAVASTSSVPAPRAAVAAAPAPSWADGSGAPAGPELALPPIETIAVNGAVSPATSSTPAGRQLAPAGQVEVHSGDNLWSIAEDHLAETSGRPAAELGPADVAPYWWSVCELNRPALRSGHPSLVYPGEVIRLPAVLSDGQGFAPGTAAPAPTPGRLASPPGSSSSVRTGPSVDEAPAPTAAGSTSTAPASTSTSTSTSTTVSSAPAAVAPAASPAPGPGAGPRPDPASRTPAPAPSRPRPIVSVSPWAMRAAMAGALGLPIFALAGWLARLRRGRAIQASRARPGRDVVRTDPEVEPLERVARVIAADQTEEWVDAALRALTADLGEAEVDGVPELRCLRAGDMGLEVLLAHPFPAVPPGWESADGGYVWRLDPDIELEELRRRGTDCAALTPAAVSLGASPEGPILADLEGMAVLAVEGDLDRVRAFLAGAALELVSASWSEGVHLRVYGLEGFEGLEGVVATDGMGLVREAASMSRLLSPGAEASGSMLGARAASGADGEPWYPMVVLVGPEAHVAVVHELVDVANAGSGVAVVGMLDPAEAEWRLIVGIDGTAVLKPLELGMRMSGITDLPSHTVDTTVPSTAAPAAVDETLGGGDGDANNVIASEGAGVETTPTEAAAAPTLVLGEELSTAGLTVDQGGLSEPAIGLAVGAMATVAESDDVASPIPLVAPVWPRRGRPRRREDCEVWVSILRRSPEITSVDGAIRFSGRRRLTEVLVYLAVHAAERPVQGDEIRTNCWPPKLGEDDDGRPVLSEVSAKSFHQAMSRLRATLGEGAHGWHVPSAVDGAYGIGPDLGCDWTLFRGLAAAGAAETSRPERAIAFYREALELVEGQPFADVARDAFPWAESGPLVTDIRLAVARVAHELATLTRQSDPATALWATQQGLLLLPTQLSLFDHAMAASAELGDVAGLEQALAAKCWAHEQLDPDGGVPPETNELYRHLLARATEAARVEV